MRRLLLLLVLMPIAVFATVGNTPYTATFTCTGGFGPFPFTFPISDPTAMKVIMNGVTLAPTSYTIVAVNNNYNNGGSVTLVGTPCTTGWLQVLSRVTPITQTVKFYDNMPIPMHTFERGLDKLTEIDQEIWGRTLHGIQFQNNTVNFGTPMTGDGTLNFSDCTVSGTSPALSVSCPGTGGANFSSPPPIGNVTPATGAFTVLTGNHMINVQATPYNAKCDGVTDDTVAINAAIQASGGKVLQFPLGTCKISGTLTFTGINGVSMECVGGSPYASTTAAPHCEIKSTSTTLPIIDAGTATDWSIKGFYLQRVTTPVSSGASGIKGCISQLCNSPIIEDVIVVGSYNGLLLGPSGYGLITDVTVQKSNGDGILFQGQTFSNMLQWNATHMAASASDGWGIHMTVNNTPGTGATVAPWFGTYTYANSGGGIYIQGNSGTIGIGDFILNSTFGSGDGNDEIRLAWTASSVISGAMLEETGNGVTGSTLTTAASHVGNGINITAGNTGVGVYGVTQKDAAYNGILDAGAGTVITGNHFNTNALSGYKNTTGVSSTVLSGNSFASNLSYGYDISSVPSVMCALGNQMISNATGPSNGIEGACRGSYPIYIAGVLAATAKIYSNIQILAAGSAVHTFANSFSFTSQFAYHCSCTSQSSTNACQTAPASATTVNILGSGSDTTYLMCVGN